MIAARRSCVSTFGWAANVTVASPWPLLGEVNVSQSASTRADHAHSRLTVTVSDPVPPPASSIGLAPASDTPQRPTGVGAVVCVELEPPHAMNASASRNMVVAAAPERSTEQLLYASLHIAAAVGGRPGGSSQNSVARMPTSM